MYTFLNISRFCFKKQLQQSLKLLNDFKSGNLPPDIDDRQLWEAQKIKQVSILCMITEVIKLI